MVPVKFEFEIPLSDLQDRYILIKMRKEVEDNIASMSDFGRNTLVDALIRLRGSIEWCENVWLQCQRERLVNLLSQNLNMERHMDEEWHDY